MVAVGRVDCFEGVLYDVGFECEKELFELSELTSNPAGNSMGSTSGTDGVATLNSLVV
jgi:hypothetical protein